MEPDDKLAAALDRELKALPDLPAPASFAAGVMAMVRAYELRPWWLRSWFEWPLPLKWVSGLGMFALLAALAGVDLSAATALYGRVGTGLEQVSAIVQPAIGILQSIVASIPIYLWCLIALVLGISWMTALGLSVVCYRLARTHKSVAC